ncbi:hypothetical protein PG994_013761 [Apiospora phragmitis]|uniref:Uncharacterized protein n=1 Tax=Apiospora phragmitis TaxID=2905665 RepID=A0ABR1T2F4_9PEZI
MATLTSLIQALKQRACCTDPPLTQRLSDAQYSDGFDSISQGAGWSTYQKFIIPQLSQVLMPLLSSRDRISVLEVGPGPKSPNVLFCHSMYGMSPQRKYIEKALGMLVNLPKDGMVVVFHQEETLDVNGLACHRTASFPEAFLSIEDEDETLDSFAAFVTGISIQNDTAMGQALQYE